MKQQRAGGGRIKESNKNDLQGEQPLNEANSGTE